MEARRVLLEMLEEVSCFHLVEECGTILEFIDVDFLNQRLMFNILQLAASLVLVGALQPVRKHQEGHEQERLET